MGRRISARVREEAARLCAIAASTDVYASEAARLTGASGSAISLAYRAWTKSFSHTSHRRGDCWCEDWAEAESLLRCGWSPGDEVE